ncbi:MAG: DUF4040 domain-containing protein [Eubacteriales bacterium]|nr:DUF4040 domain-containing protein [Eubacteriales bacterium]
MEILNIVLLAFILVCALSVSFTKSLLSTMIIFSAQSLAMCVIWIYLRAPDLAITEAAVGAGVTSLLFYVALKKIHAIKGDDDEKK